MGFWCDREGSTPTIKAPTKASAHLGTVGNVRGCKAIDGVEADKKIQKNLIAKPPNKPPPDIYTKQQLSKHGRQRHQLRWCRPKFGWNRGCKRDHNIGSQEGVLDI